jgi:hypothetical protein
LWLFDERHLDVFAGCHARFAELFFRKYSNLADGNKNMPRTLDVSCAGFDFV